jgi:4,5-dihydroxyphthalate decarboxylase
VRTLEFEVCEMAITTYLCAKRYGIGFTALPVFLVRDFHHRSIVVNRHAGITSGADLQGREVGVNRGYTVTTGVWARGVLQDEHGVALDEVTWRPSGDEHVAQYRAPGNVVPLAGDTALADRVISGELPAAVGLTVDHPDVVSLIGDADAAGFAALRARGHYPINHLVVVRDDVLAAQPELAVDLFEAFAQSKRRYVDALVGGELTPTTADDRLMLRVAEAIGGDPLPYGIEANRAVLTELIGHAVAQHILDEPPELATLFALPTRELAG